MMGLTMTRFQSEKIPAPLSVLVLPPLPAAERWNGSIPFVPKDRTSLLLMLITTPARARRRHATATVRATTTAATTITTESTATTTVAAATAPAALTVPTTVAALHRLEAVVGRGGSLGTSLGVVVSPGLGIGRRSGRRRGGGNAGLGLAGLARDLDVDPLLGGGHLVAGVPLALAGGIRGAVGNVGVAGGSAAGGGAAGGGLLDVSVCESGGGALLDLGQAGISDGRVGLGLGLGLDGLGRLGGLGGGFALGEGSGVGDSNFLDLGDWGGLAGVK